MLLKSLFETKRYRAEEKILVSIKMPHKGQERTPNLLGIHFEGFQFSQIFGLRIEGNYSTKGYDIANIATVTHQYLQIPLLIKVGTPIAAPFGIFAEVGPAASLHLGSTTELNNTSISYNTSDDQWDFSLIAGAGVNLKLGTILIELEGRYDYGLKNLNKNSGPEVKSRAIQAIAGLTFLAKP